MGSLSRSAHGLFYLLSVQAVEGSPVPKAKVAKVAKETKRIGTTLHLTCHHHHFLIKKLYLNLTLFQKKSILVPRDINSRDCLGLSYATGYSLCTLPSTFDARLATVTVKG
jgi:hypothetical protein